MIWSEKLRELELPFVPVSQREQVLSGSCLPLGKVWSEESDPDKEEKEQESY